ncbi:hypothetical protein PENNAL_c0006G09437 [Penicillium nalgiovense]|uniref:Uncharacterized protein n=1 Tax=Penicillium nalgiovense TaxID=60175 RepID=A0A1V6Z0I7_PENNA|nr:hypothetical protein PENNAL_c0006G09437 [Penicillium nalgiovense]
MDFSDQQHEERVNLLKQIYLKELMAASDGEPTERVYAQESEGRYMNN